LEHYSQAVEFHQQGLTVAKAIGDCDEEGKALYNIAANLGTLEQYEDAMANLQGALERFQEVGDRHLEALVLYNIAEISAELKNPEKAFEYCDRALSIAIELDIPLAQDCNTLKERLFNELSGRNDSGNG
jgi:tetratricopeptide (TPR) repeat protein